MESKISSFQRIAYFFIAIVLGIVILKHGQFFLGPLAFAILLTVMLQPLCDIYERLIKQKVPAILLALLTVLIPLGLIITLFSMQITSIINNLPDITSKISEGLEQILVWLNQNLDLQKSEIQKNIPKLVNNSLSFVQKGITLSTKFIFNLLFTILVLFFLLWYRKSFFNFFLIQSRKNNREQFREMLFKIRKTLQRYLYGLLGVILILAVLNSVGLLLIGINYAIFWGSLAAFLAIIPYIGTTLGGTLPFIYAIATTDNWWQPLAVVAMYFAIQNLEGNVITPYVVGSSVSINPLVALLAILLGGFLWGIGGIILAIPAVGVVKIFLENYDRLKPLAFLMSNKVHKQDDTFWEEWDDDQYRLRK